MKLDPMRFGAVLGLMSKGRFVSYDPFSFDRSLDRFEKRAAAAGVPCIVLPNLPGGEERDWNGYTCNTALVVTGKEAEVLKPQEKALKTATKELLDLWRLNAHYADMIRGNSRTLSSYSVVSGWLRQALTPQAYPDYKAGKTGLQQRIQQDKIELAATGRTGQEKLAEFKAQYGPVLQRLQAAYQGSYNIYHAPPTGPGDVEGLNSDPNFPLEAEKLALTGKHGSAASDSKHWPLDLNQMTFSLSARGK
jgi:hypothetical protein